MRVGQIIEPMHSEVNSEDKVKGRDMSEGSYCLRYEYEKAWGKV